MSPPRDPARGGASLCLRWPGLPRAPVPCETLDTVLTAGKRTFCEEPSVRGPGTGASRCPFLPSRLLPGPCPVWHHDTRHPGTAALAAEGGQGPSPREALTARERVPWGSGGGGVPSTAAPSSWHREYYEPCIYLSHVQR